MGVLLYVCVCVCCCCCCSGLRLTLVLLRPAGCAVPTVYEQCIQNVHGLTCLPTDELKCSVLELPTLPGARA